MPKLRRRNPVSGLHSDKSCIAIISPLYFQATASPRKNLLEKVAKLSRWDSQIVCPTHRYKQGKANLCMQDLEWIGEKEQCSWPSVCQQQKLTIQKWSRSKCINYDASRRYMPDCQDAAEHMIVQQLSWKAWWSLSQKDHQPEKLKPKFPYWDWWALEVQEHSKRWAWCGSTNFSQRDIRD